MTVTLKSLITSITADKHVSKAELEKARVVANVGGLTKDEKAAVLMLSEAQKFNEIAVSSPGTSKSKAAAELTASWAQRSASSFAAADEATKAGDWVKGESNRIKGTASAAAVSANGIRTLDLLVTEGLKEAGTKLWNFVSSKEFWQTPAQRRANKDCKD